MISKVPNHGKFVNFLHEFNSLASILCITKTFDLIVILFAPSLFHRCHLQLHMLAYIKAQNHCPCLTRYRFILLLPCSQRLLASLFSGKDAQFLFHLAYQLASPVFYFSLHYLMKLRQNSSMHCPLQRFFHSQFFQSLRPIPYAIILFLFKK